VVDIVQNYPVWGVDVRAGVEKSVGEKDPVLLGQFIANASGLLTTPTSSATTMSGRCSKIAPVEYFVRGV